MPSSRRKQQLLWDWRTSITELPDLSPDSPVPDRFEDAALRGGYRAGARLDLNKCDPPHASLNGQPVKTDVVDRIKDWADVSRVVFKALQERPESLEKFAEQSRS